MEQNRDALTPKQFSVLNALLFGTRHVLEAGLWADFTPEEQEVINTLMLGCYRILKERGDPHAEKA